jgi:hypothetical protein
MSKRHSALKVRVQFEPNRFSLEYLNSAYEQLKPIETRIFSKEHQQGEVAPSKVKIEGRKK